MGLLLPDGKDGRTALELLQEERWRLQRMGVGYADWRLMTQWQRRDALLRNMVRLKKLSDKAGSGLDGLLGAVVEAVLGF